MPAERTASNNRLASSNRLLALAMLVLSIAGMGGTFMVGQRLADIQSRIHPPPEEEQRRLQRQLQIDAKVEKELGRIGEMVDADRSLVFLAHNGTTDLTGFIPFMYLSNVYANLRPGVIWKEQWSQPRPMSSFSPTLRKIFSDPTKPKCVIRHITDADMSPQSKAWMTDRGNEAWAICPLMGRGGVSGLLVLEFLHKETLTLPENVLLGRALEGADALHSILTDR